MKTNTYLNMEVKINQPPANPYVTDESEHSLDSGMIDNFYSQIFIKTIHFTLNKSRPKC